MSASKAARLRKLAPDVSDADLARVTDAGLADTVIRLTRAAVRADRQHQAELARQRKADGRRPGQQDAGELARAITGRIATAERRAVSGHDIRALATLGEAEREARAAKIRVTAALSALGIPDGVISEALGQTKQAAQKRRQRRHVLSVRARGEVS